MGYVPAGPVSPEGSRADVPGCEHRRIGAGRSALTPQQLAVAGETFATCFLRSRRARILERNVRVGRGEIDLLVAFGNLRVAVEVKTIQTGGLDDPAYAFTSRKAVQVRSLANRLGVSRVDLVAVSIGRAGVDIRWIPEVA